MDHDRRTAALLLGFVLDKDRAQLFAHPEDPIESAAYQSYMRLIRRRASGEPLQYITGVQEFFGLQFRVSPAVLIPRPETEHLVEQVLKLVQHQNSVIIDAGTGSGCIPVSLAVNIPEATLIATDLSFDALLVARENSERHGVEQRIDFVQTDLLNSLAVEVDVIASNPPYVPVEHLGTLQREVRNYEPRMALDGGSAGLNFYRRMIAESGAHLKPGGYLVLEIGMGQLERITDLAGENWFLHEVTDDLQGIPRVVTFKLA